MDHNLRREAFARTDRTRLPQRHAAPPKASQMSVRQKVDQISCHSGGGTKRCTENTPEKFSPRATPIALDR